MSRFERWSRRKRGLEADHERDEHTPASIQTPADLENERASPDVGLSPTPGEEHAPAVLQEQEAAQPQLQPDSLADTIDAQLPDPDTLAPGSDLSAFLQAGVSPSLKRRALRRMFAAESYNQRDGLDDYDHDFTKMRKLSGENAAQLRRWMHKLTEDADETASSETATDENASKIPAPERTQEAAHAANEPALTNEHQNNDPDKETSRSAFDPARSIDRSV
ncbi:DUF3306 domain-containing protein [Halomonas sp. GXIMD04776]|uniref:DUF3306 domain-containing protein n=1 Tax=Halomonas sp. GXIMD04776 TaxID=3415605 RepID=UPI003C9769E3